MSIFSILATYMFYSLKALCTLAPTPFRTVTSRHFRSLAGEGVNGFLRIIPRRPCSCNSRRVVAEMHHQRFRCRRGSAGISIFNTQRMTTVKASAFIALDRDRRSRVHTTLTATRLRHSPSQIKSFRSNARLFLR